LPDLVPEREREQPILPVTSGSRHKGPVRPANLGPFLRCARPLWGPSVGDNLNRGCTIALARRAGARLALLLHLTRPGGASTS
jgi:hypothetical protein